MKVSVPIRVSNSASTVALVLTWMLLFSYGAQAQTFKVLYRFTGGADGGNPISGVLIGTFGNLYGTANSGGTPGCTQGLGCGTVFELTPGSSGWTFVTLYTFTGGPDGGNPWDRPTLDNLGNLYGTASAAGLGNCAPYGCGVAFELTPGSSGWTENVLHSFNGADGSNPIAGLTFDKRGHLYSTIPSGQVYELTMGMTGWKEKTLYNFIFGGNAGCEPTAPVILDVAGNLYGTTSGCGSFADGTAFELLQGSWREKTLHEFAGLDGNSPWAGLVFDKAGNLYGTTKIGGKYDLGTVFKLAPTAGGKWKEIVIHNFKGGTDGAVPYGTPAFDKSGNLYGTTYNGGSSDTGTVFKLTPRSGDHWNEKVLYAFKRGSNGSHPYYGSLAIDTAGNLYGTAALGGQGSCVNGAGCGVVFEITP